MSGVDLIGDLRRYVRIGNRGAGEARGDREIPRECPSPDVLRRRVVFAHPVQISAVDERAVKSTDLRRNRLGNVWTPEHRDDPDVGEHWTVAVGGRGAIPHAVWNREVTEDLSRRLLRRACPLVLCRLPRTRTPHQQQAQDSRTPKRNHRAPPELTRESALVSWLERTPLRLGNIACVDRAGQARSVAFSNS